MSLVHTLLSGKWKILILWFLSSRVLRFNDIRKKLPGVTQKMITQQLRSLENDHLIFRHVYPVVPPKVEYGLTELGRKVIPIMELMHSFGVEYLAQGFALADADKPEDAVPAVTAAIEGFEE